MLILGNILAFIVALGVIVFVHEAGHLLVAKAFRMRVMTFSLGFGKRLWGFEKGGTDSFTRQWLAMTDPCPTSTPRRTVAFSPIHTSPPMRTGDFTMPWSLMGRSSRSKRWSKSQT